MSSAQQDFEHIAAQVIEDSFRMDPVGATWMGEHSFDSELPDLTKMDKGNLPTELRYT